MVHEEHGGGELVVHGEHGGGSWWYMGSMGGELVVHGESDFHPHSSAGVHRKVRVAK